MSLLEPVLALATILIAVVSLVAIIRPIARLGLGTRKRTLSALALSFVGFVAVATLFSDASPEPQSSKLQPTPATTENQPRKTSQSDTDADPSPSMPASDPISGKQEQQIATVRPNSSALVNDSDKHVQDHSFSIKISRKNKAGIWLAVNTTLPDHIDIRVSISRAIVRIEDKKIVTDSGIIMEQVQEKSLFS